MRFVRMPVDGEGMPTTKNVLRLGELLTARGALTREQVEEILATQKRRGRPFGDLAERMFGVRPEVVEDAWAEQYAQMADRVDAGRLRPDAEALGLIEGAQAREFGLLPVEINGDEVMLCTTPDNLARALRFVGWRIGKPAYFVLAEESALERAIQRHYAA
jgi:MSHA biogenesis protein MshE